MSSVFMIYFEDALDHSISTREEFATYDEAKVVWESYVKDGPSGYDIAVELCEVVGDYEDIIPHDYHEWFTQEEWEAAHPSGHPD